MFELLKRILLKIGIDKSIAYSSGGKVVQAVTGLCSIFFIGTFLSPEEQGYYFTFGSLVAMQVFFELGLNNVITQFTAHENANLSYHADSGLCGATTNISRLSSILRFSVRWFSFLSILFFLIVCGVGIIFFYSSAKNIDNSVEWLGPWIIVSFLSGITVFLSPIYAILMGLRYVKHISKMRFFQALLMPISIWIGLWLGLGLYSISLSLLTSVLIGVFVVVKNKLYRHLRWIWLSDGINKISYREEVFPLQWKMALSWISGYFIYQLFNPVLFYYSGPVVAGKMGMTLQVLNAIQAFSFSWMSTKIPLYSTLVAKREYNKLDKLFNQTKKQMLFVCSTILILFVFVLALIEQIPIVFLSGKFLNGFPLYVICLSIISNQLLSSYANYLRCYKKEPLYIVSLITALICAVSAIVNTRLYGVNGLVLGYTLIISFIELPIIYYIYIKKKNEWQRL